VALISTNEQQSSAEQSRKRPLAWHSLGVFVDSPVELSVWPEEQFPPQRTPNTVNIKWEQQYIAYWLIKRGMYTCMHVERAFYFSFSNSSGSPGILIGPTIPSTSEVNGTACEVDCLTPFTNTPSWGRYAQ